MSHSRTVMEPAVKASGGGLTVLVGPNNCGKSAVVSALQTLAYNASGDYMVRHGERDTRVIVETDDGHVLAWRRSRDSVSYEIDGRSVHRVGRGVPDDLHDLLRLPRVSSAEEYGEGFDVHFGTQKEPIFLLDSSERKAAVFFASSSDAALLMQMQEKHREKVKEREGEKKRLEGRMESLRESLDALDSVTDLSAKVAAVEGEYQRLVELEDSRRRLGEDIEALEIQRRQCAFSELRSKALSPLARPPEMKETTSLEAVLQWLDGVKHEIEIESAALEELSPLAEPPSLEPTLSLEAILRDGERALAEACSAEAELKLLEGQLNETLESVRAWARENPICPTCGMEIDSDRLLSVEAAHSPS